MQTPSFTVRTMTPHDLPAVGVFAGRLVRLHHEFDPQRFLALPNPESGYVRYFSSQLDADDVVLLVADVGGVVVGYAFARMEPRSYDALREACGALHDIYVDEPSRGQGVAEALVREAIQRLEARGAPRVVLLTATQNETAQRLFERLGFRTTMLEMTRESRS